MCEVIYFCVYLIKNFQNYKVLLNGNSRVDRRRIFNTNFGKKCQIFTQRYTNQSKTFHPKF